MPRNNFAQQSENYQRIEKAIQFIEKHYKSRPDLNQMAASVHLSRYHFDRLFKRWVGISPIQFMQYLTLDYAKQKLAAAQKLLDVSLDTGLSGPGRLHDLFITFEALSPGEFKNQGAGLEVTYGFSPTPFGECLLATTARGICHLGFVQEHFRPAAREELFQQLPQALFRENPHQTDPLIKEIFRSNRPKDTRPFNLHLKGTNFQINVWRALLKIPEGWLVSYQDIAFYLGQPKAFRAVANAVALNPISYLIPCHRVIFKSGKIHRYHWGTARKKALIGWEAAYTQTA